MGPVVHSTRDIVNSVRELTHQDEILGKLKISSSVVNVVKLFFGGSLDFLLKRKHQV